MMLMYVSYLTPIKSAEMDYHKSIYLNSGFTFTQYDREIMKKADIVIDTMLGTGIKGEIKSHYAEIFQELNSMNDTIVSIHLPSGMPADESPVQIGRAHV